MQCARVCVFDHLKETVWFDKRSIANILSLSLLVKERRVFMDSEAENAFYVFDQSSKALKVMEQGQGI